MDNLVFISVQPDDLTFAWQIEVYIENFLKHGYTNEYHVLMFLPYDRISLGWNPEILKLEARYKNIAPNVKFFYFVDTLEHYTLRAEVDYIPLLRPYCLKQHFKNYPELFSKIIFYHDCDIVFTKYLDFQQFINDRICYLSDTKGYLNSDYFDAKKRVVLEDKLLEYNNLDVLDSTAKLVGINRDTCVYHKNRTGGAQYILKEIDYKFWVDVEKACVDIRKHLSFSLGGINKQFFADENTGIQSWCADMWAILWNLWKRLIPTETPDILNFAWATDDISKWDDVYIYHNAGVTDLNKSYLFYKGSEIYKQGLSTPYKEDLSFVNNRFCSYNYVLEILNVKQKYGYN